MIARLMFSAIAGLMAVSPALRGQAAPVLVTVRGIAYDSLHGRPLSGAFIVITGTSRSATSDSSGRFAFDKVTPGTYRFVMQHDVLDSIGMSGASAQAVITDGHTIVRVSVPSFATLWRAACHTPTPPRDSGFLFGSVRASAGMRSAARAAISASWIDVVGFDKTTGVAQHRWRLDAAADSVGNYTLCGVPTTTAIKIRAATDSAVAQVVDVLPLDRERVARRDLVLERPAARDSVSRSVSALLKGRVLSDTTHKPIANAEVSVTELGIHEVTNDSGQFRLTGIPPGTYGVQVRRIGYGQLHTRVTFADRDSVDRTLYLDRITTLDSVNVTAKTAPQDLMLEAFAEHKARGFGSFLTRDELEKRGGTLPAVMSQMPGVTIVHGQMNRAWVLGRRQGTPPQCQVPRRTRQPVDPIAKQCFAVEGWYLPENFEADQGMQLACYARVYVDRVLENGYADPFDLSSIAPSRIEAIEWYAGNSATPPEYMSARAKCGLLIIHTRRSP